MGEGGIGCPSEAEVKANDSDDLISCPTIAVAADADKIGSGDSSSAISRSASDDNISQPEVQDEPRRTDGAHDTTGRNDNDLATSFNSSANSLNSSCHSWGKVRKAVVKNSTKKVDIWESIREAVAEAAGVEHPNDKNDRRGNFSFREFRRDLSVLRRSQQRWESIGDETTYESWDSDTEHGIAEVEDEAEEEDSQDISLQEEDFDFSDDISTSNQPDKPKVKFDRRGLLEKSTHHGKSGSLSKFHLTRSDRRGGIYSSLKSNGIKDMVRLSDIEAFTNWARSFYRLDPRYMILSFFNDLALQGMDNLKSMGGIIPAEKRQQIPFMLRVFNRAGVFSVWRPTSMDAIRKIMTGEGVGKGLDIKGKSALRGKYSGFVPFMQIHKNEDKKKVCSMTTYGRVRVFYPNKISRDKAAILLKPLRDLMVNRTNDSMKIIRDTEEKEAMVLQYAMQNSFQNLSAPSERPTLAQMKHVVGESRRLLNTGPMAVDKETFRKALNDKHDTEMADPCVRKIDNYASDQGVFGLDIPEKLFWEAFVVKNDITREEGSEYDTGRPSMPEFQTMNFETLRKKPKKNSKSLSSDPRPVLYHVGCGSKGDPLENSNPLCPLGLLMAYEENFVSFGKVTPVVSDFDAFLVGTRGIEFREPLGEQELSMLSMCVDDIEGILSSPKPGIGWTKRWLEVKKNHLRKGESSQEMPKFGYADPASYTMMNGAVHRLKSNGAVRHGPECFNYGFPQELDGQYLVISDTFPGQVPWKYVNSAELITILSKKIDEGYTFPMNPKWILCDPGFKLLYDKLLSCDKPNVQESMSIWYPNDVRERIHKISKKYPRGFDQSTTQQAYGQTSGVSVDLAQMELEHYRLRRSSLRKIKRALLKPRRATSAEDNPTLFSTTLHMLQLGRDVDKNSKKVAKSGFTDGDRKDCRGHRFDDIKGMSIKEEDFESSKEDKSSSRRRSRRRSRRASISSSFNQKVVKPIQKVLDLERF